MNFIIKKLKKLKQHNIACLMFSLIKTIYKRNNLLLMYVILNTVCKID